jgi:hypothetical protein
MGCTFPMSALSGKDDADIDHVVVRSKCRSINACCHTIFPYLDIPRSSFFFTITASVFITNVNQSYKEARIHLGNPWVVPALPFRNVFSIAHMPSFCISARSNSDSSPSYRLLSCCQVTARLRAVDIASAEPSQKQSTPSLSICAIFYR